MHMPLALLICGHSRSAGQTSSLARRPMIGEDFEVRRVGGESHYGVVAV
jgi:hypothetical protein